MMDRLYPILDKVIEPGYFVENEIISKIHNFIKEECTDKKIEPCSELLYEETAFTFMEVYKPDKEWSGWEDLHYGPIFSVRDKNGNLITNPDIKSITPEMVNYWEKRSVGTNNPILQYRYTGLVWDFSQKIKNEKPDVIIAHRLIDSLITLALLDKKGVHIKYKLKRSLETAISINDQNRILKIKNTIIQYEDTHSKDKSLGTWGYSFDWLIADKKLSKKVQLSKKQEEKIIHNLEKRLKNLSDKNSSDFYTFGVEHVATKLAPYYKGKNDINNLKRVLLKYRDSFLNASLSVLAGESILDKVRGILFQYGLSEEAKEMEPAIRRFQGASLRELKKIETRIPVPKEQIDNYYFELDKRNLFEALNCIAISFVPDKEQSKNLVLKLSQEHPLGFLFSQNIMDYKGRTVTKIGPIKDDLEGHVVRQMCQQFIDINLPFIILGFQYLEQYKSLNVDSLSEHLFKSPVFPQTHHQTIKEGLRAFFEKNYIASCSILTPQVEAALREIIRNAGGEIYQSSSKEKGFDLRPLGSLLRDEKFINIFKNYKSMPDYLLVLLVDKRGYNLRNSICHGDFPSHNFNQITAILLIHTLLILSLVKMKDGKGK